MAVMNAEETQEAIQRAKELRQLVKTDPELRRAIINAKDNRLPVDPNRPTPKERYDQWVKETLSSISK